MNRILNGVTVHETLCGTLHIYGTLCQTFHFDGTLWETFYFDGTLCKTFYLDGTLRKTLRVHQPFAPPLRSKKVEGKGLTYISPSPLLHFYHLSLPVLDFAFSMAPSTMARSTTALLPLPIAQFLTSLSESHVARVIGIKQCNIDFCNAPLFSDISRNCRIRNSSLKHDALYNHLLSLLFLVRKTFYFWEVTYPTIRASTVLESMPSPYDSSDDMRGSTTILDNDMQGFATSILFLKSELLAQCIGFVDDMGCRHHGEAACPAVHPHFAAWTDMEDTPAGKMAVALCNWMCVTRSARLAARTELATRTEVSAQAAGLSDGAEDNIRVVVDATMEIMQCTADGGEGVQAETQAVLTEGGECFCASEMVYGELVVQCGTCEQNMHDACLTQWAKASQSLCYERQEWPSCPFWYVFTHSLLILTY